jgi:hypothetical protein
MKILILPLASLIAFGTSAQTPAQEVKVAEKSWTCAVTTEGAQLIWSRYTGDEWANIHIAPFNRPGSYKVVKEGDVAKGKTSNGTEFVCKLA